MKKRGFTLIEMLIVIVIIGILAGALIPRIGNARDKAQDVAIQANVNAIVSAGMQAILDDETPCSGDVIDYTTMTAYGMTDLGTDYSCRQVAGDHIIVWTEEMHIEDNNNCLDTDLDDLDDNTALNAVMAVVGRDDSTEGATGNNVYCLAQ